MASHLLECGVNPYDVYESIYERRSKEQLCLLSKSINNLNFYFNDTVCGSIITKKMQKESGANPSHVEGFTDFFRSINKVQIAFCIVEQKNNIRINFRSRGKYIINDVAKKFGGGGHKLAAGATINGKTLDEAGNILSENPGYINYTIGQRKGIGISNKNPLYVKKINAEKNEITVGKKESLFSSDCYISNVNWLIKNHKGIKFIKSSS